MEKWWLSSGFQDTPFSDKPAAKSTACQDEFQNLEVLCGFDDKEFSMPDAWRESCQLFLSCSRLNSQGSRKEWTGIQIGKLFGYYCTVLGMVQFPLSFQYTCSIIFHCSFQRCQLKTSKNTIFPQIFLHCFHIFPPFFPCDVPLGWEAPEASFVSASL